jgi:hypothetical protein
MSLRESTEGSNRMRARISSLPILVRLMAVSTFVLVAVAAALVLAVKDRVEQAMHTQAQDEVVHANSLLHYFTTQKGQPALKDGKLVFGDWVANGDNSVVDLVTEKSGAVATLFQLQGDKLVRVATSVKKPDGTRGTGTVLEGPAAAAFLRGESYVGDNPILDKMYVTKYELIRDPAGRPIGFWLTGITLQSIGETSGMVVGLASAIGLAGLLLGLGLVYLVVRPISRGVGQVAAAAQASRPATSTSASTPPPATRSAGWPRPSAR